VRIGDAGSTRYWFVDVPGEELLKRAGESYYDRMTAPVPASWVLKFDLPVFERMGAGWFIPVVRQLAAGRAVTFERAVEIIDEGRPGEPPEIDTVAWDR